MNTRTFNQTLYWLFTGLLALLMVGSAGLGLADYSWAIESYARLGFPPYLVLPVEIAKLLGIAAIVSGVSSLLKNLAYAGCFYQLLLALSAHLAAGDPPGTMIAAVSGLVFVAGSFHFDRRRNA